MLSSIIINLLIIGAVVTFVVNQLHRIIAPPFKRQARSRNFRTEHDNRVIWYIEESRRGFLGRTVWDEYDGTRTSSSEQGAWDRYAALKEPLPSGTVRDI
jgi:hypothetical protein